MKHQKQRAEACNCSRRRSAERADDNMNASCRDVRGPLMSRTGQVCTALNDHRDSKSGARTDYPFAKGWQGWFDGLILALPGGVADGFRPGNRHVDTR